MTPALLAMFILASPTDGPTNPPPQCYAKASIQRSGYVQIGVGAPLLGGGLTGLVADGMLEAFTSIDLGWVPVAASIAMAAVGGVLVGEGSSKIKSVSDLRCPIPPVQ